MRLLELRISNKLSQKRASGKALDLTQQRISLLEQGKSYPNSIEITKYATYFDVSADYVLEISPRKILLQKWKVWCAETENSAIKVLFKTE